MLFIERIDPRRSQGISQQFDRCATANRCRVREKTAESAQNRFGRFDQSANLTVLTDDQTTEVLVDCELSNSDAPSFRQHS